VSSQARTENSNTDENEVECKDILCGALPVHLFFVLGRVCTMVWVIDEVEHWESLEFELRPGRVAMRSLLNPFRLARLPVQRQALLSPSPKLDQIHGGFTFVLSPSPESETRPLVREQKSTNKTENSAKTQWDLHFHLCVLNELPEVQRGGNGGGRGTPDGIVGGSHVRNNPEGMGVAVDERIRRRNHFLRWHGWRVEGSECSSA